MKREIEYSIKKYTNNKKKYKDFWYGFGYEYIAPLVNKIDKEKKKITKEYINNKYSQLEYKENFIIKELLFLYYNLWNKKDFDKKSLSKRLDIQKRISKAISDYKSSKHKSIDFDYIENHLRNKLSRKEKIEIQSLPILYVQGDESFVHPLTVDGEYNIAAVSPWPEAMSGEKEALNRLNYAAQDINVDLITVDGFGRVLNEETNKMTNHFVDGEELEFVISTHYETDKTVDTFYYHTVWNPPEIPLNLGEYYTRISNNYLMNDDYLIYDFGGMSNHLKGVLLNKPRTTDNASILVASFPKSIMFEPKLNNPKLFYCGMNWEKVVHNGSRHNGLFKMLDTTGNAKFYGPDKVAEWGGIRPWEGYESYQYSIPFDGFSILKEINECGICLVLSSDIHRRAGAVTNRAYEACAAGAVIISDDNEFMQYYFKDAALFIDYNKNDPEDTFNQIMEKYDWIVNHKEEAIKMAKRAQEIFKKHFSVDKQLLDVVNNHYSRFKTIEGDLFAKNENNKVLVTYVLDTLDKDEAIDRCTKVIKNVKNQYYENITLAIACDNRLGECVNKLIESSEINCELFLLDLYDFKKSKQYTDGQVIRIMQNNIKHDYWMNMFSHETWFYDHVTTLVRTIQDDESWCAYSAREHKDKKGYARTDFFENIHVSTVFNMNWPDWLPVPGQMLFDRRCEEEIPEFMDECLDGYEHYAYLNMIWIRNKHNISFSKRMTSVWNAEDMDNRNIILKSEYQIRFIRDISKFYLPEDGLNNCISRNDSGTFKENMLNFHIKPWFMARYYNSLLRFHTKKGSRREKKLQEKYNKQLARFME